MIPEKVYG